MSPLSTSDAYDRVVALIASHNGSRIPVPELARLLRVKATTLNARLRRTQIPVRMVGRTNYVPPEIAMNLAAHHKYALMGWPTLQKASQLVGVKSGTLKARCEKGRLEGHLDLTKRLRINPIALEHVSLSRRKRASSEIGPCREDDLHPSAVPAAARAEIKILRCADYGLPETVGSSQANGAHSQVLGNMEVSEGETPGGGRRGACPTTKDLRKRHANGGSSKRSQGEPKRAGYLSYNPDKVFSVSECFVGRTIRYGAYDGTIVKVLDDPFSPRIKVYFSEHPHPLMSEVLLAVGKRQG